MSVIASNKCTTIADINKNNNSVIYSAKKSIHGTRTCNKKKLTIDENFLFVIFEWSSRCDLVRFPNISNHFKSISVKNKKT